jgi:hypothetical protein
MKLSFVLAFAVFVAMCHVGAGVPAQHPRVRLSGVRALRPRGFAEI